MADFNNIDPIADKLTQAIGLQEGGGKFNYNAVGDAGTSRGAFQWQPGNFEADATDAGLDPSDFSPKNQNKVAYAKVKSMLDSGLKPWQVSAAWNAGEGKLKDDAWKTNVGDTTINGQKVHYDTPAYVNNVKNYYNKLSGGSSTETPTTPDPTQAPEAGPHKDFLDNVGGFINSIFPGKTLGDAAGASLDSIYQAIKTKSWAPIEQQAQENNQNMGKILADTGGIVASALPIAGPAGKGVLPFLGRLGTTMAAGGAATGLETIAGGETDPGTIAKNTAIGAGVAGIVHGTVEGLGKAYEGIASKLGTKTAAEILATPESELGKLTPKERQFYSSEKIKAINAEHSAREAKIQEDLTKAKDQSKIDLEKASTDFKTATDNDAAKVRENIVDHLGDANKKYGKLLDEALAPVEDMPVSNKDLNDYLNNKYYANPEAAQPVKDLLGINEADFVTAKNGVSTPQDTTVGELYSRLSELKSEISKAGKAGSKALTPDEYAKSKAVDDLMGFIKTQAEGTPFAETIQKANDLWKEWAPLRDRIFREVKPFDQSGVVEVPLKKTISKVVSGKASAETQNFVSKLQEMTGEPITEESKAAFNKLDNVKQQAILDKVSTETQKIESKLIKQAAKEGWNKTKLLSEIQAEHRDKIKQIIFNTLKLLGAGGSLYEGIKLFTNK